MLAAILAKPGEIALQEMAIPEPREGELLVEVKSSLTCGTDLKAFIRGHSLIPMPGPFGHEFSGIVVEKGKGAGKFKVGDPIMAVHSAPCLYCSYCKKGIFNLCENLMSTKVLGAYSEYLLLPKHIVRQNVFKKPKTLSFSEAAFLEPLACVVHGMEPLGIKKNDTVFIIGAGPIGLLHLILAKSKGAKVMITGLEEQRLKVAKKLGADLVFDPSQTVKSIRDFTGGIGADYIFECTGQPDIWEASVEYVRKGGTIVLFGGCKSGAIVRFKAERLHYDEIKLMGTFHFTPRDVAKAFGFLRDRKVDVRKLISGSFPLKDIKDVFAKLAKGDGIKYALIP
ncbi:Sorbitol dehydrogenase [Candidatus Sulfobium mesophilum]|uniref:Sorbitol dehydrogenase n=1 Tax=Candidatus Sulfobium mesophilum TaxID=2016548 RepID=A0A2U3QHG8_9BACT|nr:Sorbitol dehydrogenase [Candidatus Sulfobium mesophilum]